MNYLKLITPCTFALFYLQHGGWGEYLEGYQRNPCILLQLDGTSRELKMPKNLLSVICYMQKVIFTDTPLVINWNGLSFIITCFIGGLFHCTCLVASADLVRVNKTHFNQAYLTEYTFFHGLYQAENILIWYSRLQGEHISNTISVLQ